MLEVASPSVASIPDALAELASVMLDAVGLVSEDLRLEIESAAPYYHPYGAPQPAWEMEPAALMGQVKDILGSWPPVKITEAKHFAKCVIALELLDEWHAPLTPTAVDLPKTAWHHDALDTHVEFDSFNKNNKYGYVINHSYIRANASTGASPFSEPLNILSVIYALLEYTAYIPAQVVAGNPDGVGGEEVSRSISLEVRRFGYDDIQIVVEDEGLLIALAPGIQNQDEAELITDGSTYTIRPTYSESKINDIIEASIASGAHVLLMPEMSVSHEMLGYICRALPRARHNYFIERGQVPALSAIAAGIIKTEKLNSGKMHRNYLVLVNSQGKVLIEQDKLSHWNLSEASQKRFGISEKGYRIPLVEGTVIGKSITVAEIEGLGRVIGMICADMAHDMPGDWITDNIGLDAIYAPIMDGSTCWTQGAAPWIIQRSVRSCRRSGVAVVVTNSLVMTHWNNDVIQAEIDQLGDSPYKRYPNCGIGFLVKRGGGSVLINHVMVPTATGAEVVVPVSWNQGWKSIQDELALASFV